MIKLNCPYCLDPISDHGDRCCNVIAPDREGGQPCPCDRSATEILIEMVESLADAAQYARDVIGEREGNKHPLCGPYRALGDALAGIEIIPDPDEYDVHQWLVGRIVEIDALQAERPA